MQPPTRFELGNPAPQPQPQPQMQPQPQQPPHFPPPPYREEQAKAKPKSGFARIFPTFITLSAFGGLALLAWFAYQEGRKPVAEEDLPVIKADNEPFKREPENPGGEEIPHMDKEVYNTYSGEKADYKKEAVAPQAEKPMDRDYLKKFAGTGDEEASEDQFAAKQETLNFGDKAAVAAPEKPVMEAPAVTPNTGGVEAQKPVEMPPVSSAPVMEKEMVAEAYKPKQIGGDAQEEEAAVKPVETAEPHESPDVAKTAPRAPVKPDAKVEKAEKKAEKKTEKPAEKTVAPKKVVKAAPAPVKAAASTGGLHIQLGAFRSEAEAKKEWKKLQGKFKTSLSPLSMVVQKVELPDKGTMYRLQAGPLKSRDDGRTLCKRLVDAGQGCFVVK